MKRRSFPRILVDTLVVGILLVVALSGFRVVFEGWGFLVPGFGGLVLGLSVGVLGARFTWRWWGLAGASAVGYLVVGGVLAFPSLAVGGVTPTLESIGSAATGLVASWKELLTVEVPTEGYGSVYVVPLVIGLVGGCLAVSFATRLRHPVWALAPICGTLLAAILFGSYQSKDPVIQAALLAFGSITWLGWRRLEARSTLVKVVDSEGSTVPPYVGRHSLLGLAVLIGSIAAGAVVGGAVAPQGQREVLRDHVTPPLDVHQYPSPLQSYRAYVRDHADDVLFTVTGLPEDARIRLATLDGYNGVVYTATGDGGPFAGSFTRMRPNSGGASAGAQVTIVIGSLEGVWLPDVGSVVSVDFSGPREKQLASSLYYDQETGTAVVTAGLASGDTYQLNTVVVSLPDIEDVGAELAQVRSSEPRGVPDSIGALASDVLEPGDSGATAVIQLVDYLAAAGYFSHGLEGQPQSLSGHGAARISSLVESDQMIGDDEQYAVAFALMANQVGIPARVVIGFYPPEGTDLGTSYDVTGSDVHVWAEVAFEGIGWVPVDPVPEEDRTPENEDLPPVREPEPQILQPQPPPEDPAELPPSIPTDDRAVDDSSFDASTVLGFLVVLALSIAVVVTLASPILIILMLKVRRRQRRRFARDTRERFSGGWDELADLATDYGVPVPIRGTRLERARAVDDSVPDVGAVELAVHADRGIWGPDRPTRGAARRFWSEVEASLSTLHGSHRRGERWRATLSLRSLARDRQANEALTPPERNGR